MEVNSKIFSPKDDINYSLNSVVSKTIIKKPSGTITLFAFDRGEELSEHTAPFEALIQVIDGQAEITIGGKPNFLTSGQAIILPANIPHAIKANEQFKMMLTIIKE
jgi:quercetin dioxygenase-like cupin family protein